MLPCQGLSAAAASAVLYMLLLGIHAARQQKDPGPTAVHSGNSMVPWQASGAAAPCTVVLCCLVLSCTLCCFGVCCQKALAAGLHAASGYTARDAVLLLIAFVFQCCPQIYTAEEKQALALVNFAAQKEKEAKVLSDLKVGICLSPFSAFLLMWRRRPALLCVTTVVSRDPGDELHHYVCSRLWRGPWTIQTIRRRRRRRQPPNPEAVDRGSTPARCWPMLPRQHVDCAPWRLLVASG